MRRFAYVFLAFALFISFNPAGHASESAQVTAGRQGIPGRVEALLRQMTPDEKVGQLNLRFLNLDGQISDDDVRAGRVGGFLYSSDLGYTNYLQELAVKESRLHIPLLFGFDVVSGYRTIFPAPLAMASSWDPELVERTRVVAAREARAAGITWTYAPMVDIARDPRWGRIVEGAGEDPVLGAAMARAQVRGLQGPALGTPGRLLACAKHFAAYGAADGGRDYEGASVPESLLHNVYFPPFRAALDAGVGCIMSAYLDLNDVPATGNGWLLRDVLRKEWGFGGIVVSDAFSIETLTTHGFTPDLRGAALQAARAGVNIDMEGKAYATHLAGLVRDGAIDASALDALVRPVLTAKMEMGLFEKPYADYGAMESILTAPESRDLARVAAQRSTVLLKNANRLLPIKTRDWKHIAVIGPFADSQQDLLGPWTTAADFKETVSILSGIRAKVGGAIQVSTAQGAQIGRAFPSEFDVYYRAPVQPKWTEEHAQMEMDKAVALAKHTDLIILVLGEAYNMSGENASRASLDLPGRQQELLERIAATGKPVVLVLITGRPLTITHAAERVSAILLPWYPGTSGGNAIADIIFGDANPGAKLPVSWPRSTGQVPVYYAHNTGVSPRFANRRYWDEESTPLFPFGFGLSYTGFTISKPMLSSQRLRQGQTLSVSVEVQNTGTRAGDEVVQLYTHQRSGSAARPVRELKAFQRVTLGAGKRRTVTFRIGTDDLKYWSSAERKWVLDSATFDVWVGNSADASQGDVFEVVRGE